MAEREIPPRVQRELDALDTIPDDEQETFLADIEHRAYSPETEKFFRSDVLFLLRLLKEKDRLLTEWMTL